MTIRTVQCINKDPELINYHDPQIDSYYILYALIHLSKT